MKKVFNQSQRYQSEIKDYRKIGAQEACLLLERVHKLIRYVVLANWSITRKCYTEFGSFVLKHFSVVRTRIVRKCKCLTRTGQIGQTFKGKIAMQYLMRLRQKCGRHFPSFCIFFMHFWPFSVMFRTFLEKLNPGLRARECARPEIC